MTKSLDCFVRGDGVHILWRDVQRMVDGQSWHRHEIVLKLVREDVLGEGDPKIGVRLMNRIRAFAATLVVDGDPARIQKRQEKSLDSGGPQEDGNEARVDAVMSAIRSTFERHDSNALSQVRASLRDVSLRACSLLAPEEVESIVRDALAEYVLKS